MCRLVLLFICFSGFSQFKLTQYTTENGLPHDLCYQIIQDSKGYIWLGTDNGLVKFNGQDFEVFNSNQGLNSNFVIDVHENKKKKYIATWGGGCYLFENNIFKSLNDGKYKFSKQQQIISDNNGFIYSIENKKRLNVINTKNNNILELFSLQKKNGLLKWYNSKDLISTSKRNTIPLDINVVKIYNNIYVFTDRNSPNFKGLFSVNNKHKNDYEFLKGFYVIDVLKKGNNYLAVTPNSIIEFNKKKIIDISKLEFKNKSIIHYTENAKYKVYVLLNKSTSTNELLIVNKFNKNVKFYYNVLKSSVSDVLISNENSIWVSTYGNGLLLFQENILPIIKNSLKNNVVFDYIERPNNSFFLTNDYIIGTDRNYNYLSKLEFKTCAFFKEILKDTVYLVNKDQIYRNKFFINSFFKSNFDSNVFYWNNCKIEYGDNRILYLKDNKWNRVNFNIAEKDYSFLKIRQLIEYKKKLFVVSNYGLFVLNDKFKVERNLNSLNGLIRDEFKKAFVLNGKLYLMQFQSICVFDGAKFKNFPYKNNQNNFFNDFTHNQRGSIWLATQKGLVFFQDGIYKLYTKNEGLSSSYYSKIYTNHKNELVALGNNGIDVFVSKDFSSSSKVEIILTIDGTEISSFNTVFIEPSKTSILKIDLINFIKSRFQVEYRINNQKWIPLKGNNIDFSNFSFGSYNLQFRWRYFFTDWKTLKTHTIVKKGPWYFYWYYYLPIIILFTLLVSFLIKKRIISLKRRNEKLEFLLDNNEKLQFQLSEMRNNIAQDFHDELGNKLAGISVLSDKLLNDINIINTSNYKVVERIYSDSQDLFHGIRDFIWAMDSKNGTLEELVFALTDFGESLFEYSKIKFIVNNEIENPSFLLPNFWNRQLLLLFKEAMTNAYKHSMGTQLNLIFTIEENILKIECKDNGVGFNKSKLSRENGLINIKKRVAKLNAEIIIISYSGTSIVFKGKLQ